MQKYGFLLTRILPYIVDSILKRENAGQLKLVFSHLLLIYKVY